MGVEEVLDADEQPRPLQPGMTRDQCRPLGQIREQAEIDRGEGGEAQVAASARAGDIGTALPVRLDEAAEAVLEDAGAELDLVLRAAATARKGRAAQIIELGHAGPDQHIVGEAPGVEKRDLNAAAARPAHAAAASAAARTAATAARATPATAGTGTGAAAASSAHAGQTGAARARGRREGLLEVEAPAHLAPFRA